MNEQVERYVKPIKTFWGKQSKKKRTTLISVFVGIVLIAVITVLILNNTPYSVLYSGITTEEATQVMQRLQADGTSYKSESGGTTIKVPKDQVELVRMNLATAGYPNTAPNYDFFKDSVDFMTTESEKRTMKIYQLQERLQATIKTIKGVKQAIVTISAPEDNGWAWEEDKESASASVTLTLTGGLTLGPDQVSGIKRLVSTSIPGLDVSQVAVVDSTGSELKSSGDQTYVDIAKFKLEIESEFEEDVYKNIMKVLVPIVGSDNLSVAVKSRMSLDKKIKEIITYSPSGEDNTGVITDADTGKEVVKGDDQAGGVVGEESNTELPNYSGVTADEDNIYYKDYNKYKYLVNQITEQIDGNSPEVTDLTVGVTINSLQKTLTPEDKENFTQLIANASGISPAKVTIVNTDFSTLNGQPLSPQDPALQNKMLIISVSVGAIILLIGFILIFIISKKMKKKRGVKSVLVADEVEEPPMPREKMPNFEADLKKVPESKEQVLKKEIQDFSTQNPEIVAQLLRTWLKGDET